jgi:DNA polymerase-3 subunit delta'
MKLSEVHGLAKQKEHLLKSISTNRLPHAQLFLGPAGSGKLSLAHAITQYLYCADRTTTDSCGECSSCRKISSYTHPDVHYSFPTVTKTVGKKPKSDDFIEEWRTMNKKDHYFSTADWIGTIADNENKTPNITREETHSIMSKLALKPYEGEAKTLIIWMPEYLQKESNALLKLIEEPAQKTYFILVAENSDELLTTITSRTQLLKVPGYTYAGTQDFLQKKYNLDPTKAEQISYLAEGNLRRAMELVESVEDNYSALFRDWMLACFSNNLKKAGDLSDTLNKLGRVQLQIFLKNGLNILRESLLYKMIDNYQIKAEKDQQEFIKKLSKTLNASCIEKSYEQINEVIYHIQRNANGRLALYNLSLKLRYNFIR